MQHARKFTIEKDKNEYRLLFSAMASACEVLVEIPRGSYKAETIDKLVNTLAKAITDEVWRIEDKYSRYDSRSVCSLINNSKGQTVSIDQETYLLLNFAHVCYELSDGLFDITSGILRKVWTFNGSDNIPDKAQVEAILPFIGWNKVKVSQQAITLLSGMEIDLGGIGKEYAVDRCILLAKEITEYPILINLGGDLAATKPREDKKPWVIGVEHPGFENKTNMVVSLYQGALATSGNAKRFLLKDGVRYSHILNAKTGWSIINAPRSITVSSEQCVQAGILATLSLLQGENAEAYLDDQEVKYWAVR